MILINLSFLLIKIINDTTNNYNMNNVQFYIKESSYFRYEIKFGNFFRLCKKKKKKKKETIRK